ncbi:MAG: hypothetical protein A4E61_00591 [Syntrophorhabdus sp. PtaB.Bin184]|jgi:hypothetical protein|nr:MAG: hypothetical protein A4E61_00591 [Syntrophorhabdus sp. PtaB.Bin184]
MLVRYLPGKFEEGIPVPVQKKIVFHEREGKNGGKLVFETGDGKRQEIQLEHCAPLMSGEKRIGTWLKMGGLFLLLIAFCAGGCGIGLKMYAEGIAGISILAVLQFIVSGGLVAYVSWVFKVTVERYLYGGLSFDRGDIYFQSDEEKSMFGDIAKKQKRR